MLFRSIFESGNARARIAAARRMKELRKWIGTLLTGAKKTGFEEERRAAEFLDSIGVIYNVWPTAQTKPDGPKNLGSGEGLR